MPRISFVSDVNGANYSKTRKRVRGDRNKRAEIKTFDPFKVYAQNSYLSHSCFCGYSVNQTNDDANNKLFHWNHNPWRVNYPAQGVGEENRVGNEIFLKYIRIKGMVQVDNYNPCGVRWRLIMLKLNPGGNDDNLDSMSIYEYLNMFQSTTRSYPSSWTEYDEDDESVGNFDDTEGGTLMNYYYKVKDVVKWTGWKRKVVASGYVPPNWLPYAWGGTVTGPGTNPQIDLVAIKPETYGDACVDYYFNSPLDVKITLNDRVNCSKMSSVYYFVFEADCGCNFTVQDGYPHSSTRGHDGSPVKLNFIAKAYFSDA